MARNLDLLIVDDDAAQVSVLGMLLQQMGMPHTYHYCSSGGEALDYLHRRHPFEEAGRPHLILLDLNMPGMDGCEVLRRVKSDPQLRSIPVVMLSSSRALKDVDACYSAHANAYMAKPSDLAGNMALLEQLDQYWNACELPPD